MASLIPAPVLDDRNDEQFAARMIGRVSGGLTPERVLSQIAFLRETITLLQSGTLPAPICPELTNANASSPHTVLLETLGWSMSQQARKINLLPVRDQIAFANLFGVTMREAVKATTTLRFTSDGQREATVPAGTEVSTADGSVAFVTTAELVIAANQSSGTVPARCTIAGARLLADGVLTKSADVIAFINEVTNPDPVDSGAEAEIVDSALARARNKQRRAERLVSAQDVEDFILEEVMQGVGIVRAFPFIKAGDFSVPKAGYVSIVVMTPAGNVVSAEVKAAIAAGLSQLIGSIYPNLLDPDYISFSVNADIKVESIAPQDAIKAAVERNLRSFFAPRKGNFGRKILRSEIISVIEGTPGVDRIVSHDDGPIVQAPSTDLEVAPYQLPKLVAVTLSVVP